MINDINTNFIEVRVTIYKKKQLYSVRYRADEFEIQIQVPKILIDFSQSNVFFLLSFRWNQLFLQIWFNWWLSNADAKGVDIIMPLLLLQSCTFRVTCPFISTL